MTQDNQYSGIYDILITATVADLVNNVEFTLIINADTVTVSTNQDF